MNVDKEKLAMLVRHWIDHNEGHRESYLEWRNKLEGEALPATSEALLRVADLTAEANRALNDALAELQAGGAAVSSQTHEHHHHEGHQH